MCDNKAKMLQYLLLMVNVFLISVAQILLKYGADKLSGLEASKSLLAELISRLLNPYIFAGGLAYIASFVLWIYILSKNKVSFAYPIMSLSYVAVMVLSVYFLKEKITFHQWLGAAFIILGTSFIFCKH